MYMPQETLSGSTDSNPLKEAKPFPTGSTTGSRVLHEMQSIQSASSELAMMAL